MQGLMLTVSRPSSESPEIKNVSVEGPGILENGSEKFDKLETAVVADVMLGCQLVSCPISLETALNDVRGNATVVDRSGRVTAPRSDRQKTADVSTKRKRWGPADPHQVFATAIDSSDEEVDLLQSEYSGLPKWCQKRLDMISHGEPEVDNKAVDPSPVTSNQRNGFMSMKNEQSHDYEKSRVQFLECEPPPARSYET